MTKSRVVFREDNEYGFTMIEVMVTVLILGILSAIAVPAFLNQRNAAIDTSLRSDIRGAAMQIEAYSGSTEESVPSFTIENPAGGDPSMVTPEAGYSLSSDNFLTEIRVSDGNTIRVTGSSEVGQYFIVGSNPNGTDLGKSGITYDPMQGGFTN